MKIKYMVKKFGIKEVLLVLKKKEGHLLTVEEARENLSTIRKHFEDNLQGSLKLLRLLVVGKHNLYYDLISYKMTTDIGDELITELNIHNGNLCNIVYKKDIR